MNASACSHKAREADLSLMPSAHSLRTDSAASTGEKPAPATIADGLAIPNRQIRIDSGHALTGLKSPEIDAATPVQQSVSAKECEPSRPTQWVEHAKLHQSWMQLHAIELIEKLQSWSADLDAREAQLNARTALLEHRERQLRLEQQNSRLDLDELRSSLQREVAEMRATARRLAFE